MIRFTPRVPIILLVAAIGGIARADEPKPPELTVEEQKRVDEALSLDAEGGKLFEQRRSRQALEKFRAALRILEEIFPKDSYPRGHLLLAGERNNIGGGLLDLGDWEGARAEQEAALGMYRALVAHKSSKEGEAALASTVNNLGYLERLRGNLERSRDYYQEALERIRASHPAGHPMVATVVNNLGALARLAGDFDDARRRFKESLAMRQSQFPGDHPAVAQSISNLASVEEDAGRFELSRELHEQALAMRRRLYPPERYKEGHSDLATSLNNLGILHREVGNLDLSKQFFAEALAMYRRLDAKKGAPSGHLFLQRCLNNFANLLSELKERDRARELYEESLALLREQFPRDRYPNGHPELALTLSNMAVMLREAGSKEKAFRCHEEALAINRAYFVKSKYPNGHVWLADTIHGMGVAYQMQRDFDAARRLYEEAAEMSGRLFPPQRFPAGHPQLARTWEDVGGLLNRLGADAEALPWLERAFAMRRSLADRFIASSAEAESLAYLKVQPTARDQYLSAAAGVPGTDAAAYRAVWPTRAGLTRVLEQRYAAARAAGTEQAAKLERARAVRRRLDQLLQDLRLPSAERDRLLAAVSDERDRLERELTAALPALGRWKQRDALGPDDLAQALPPGAAFIDLVRYTDYQYDPPPKGKGELRLVSRYAAFVVVRGREVRRVELGGAKAIDEAVLTWRRAITEGGPAAAPTAVRGLWEPLAKCLPAGTHTLYLASDGQLAGLSWAALPVGDGRVLLEDFAVATIPHGLFLLEQLKFPLPAGGSSAALAMGEVDYGSSPWTPLPGTVVELAALRQMAPAASTVLTRLDATPGRLAEGLKRARWAHLATHGFFDADALRAEQRRAEQILNAPDVVAGERRVAGRNPLGFVGLVLSGGEVMSGLSILDLNLEGLKLATLSACETGLGEYIGNKGVENLQMAFHLAGCPNVVASLWKVNDAATAALMAKFYHELWVNKKAPIEALRESQLTIYRHPELIPDLAGERGAPKLKEAVAVKTTGTSPVARHADTKLWAAFMLSGAGR